MNGTVWSVDMLLDDDGIFWVHPRVSNPNNGTILGYWWTCVAMPVDHPDGRTRIVAPSKESINYQCASWPDGGVFERNSSFRGPDLEKCTEMGHCAWQQDMSFLGNIPNNYDFFMNIKDRDVPYITHVRSDGYAVVHAHSSELNGTKFFTWGFGEHGTHMQDFLSSNVQPSECNANAYDPSCASFDHNVGAYTELQTGPALTQRHYFPLAAQTSMQWTEWFKGWQGNAEALQSPRYDDAIDAVDDFMRKTISADRIAQVDAALTALSEVEPTQILARGLPWGGLEEIRRGKPFARGTPFPSPDPSDPGIRPWLELIQNGTFSTFTLQQTPVSFLCSDEWISVLETSRARHGATWLHFLYLGTHAFEVGNVDSARKFLNKSMALKESAHAARALAMLAKNVEDATAMYFKAWSLALNALRSREDDDGARQLCVDLSSELAGWLMGNERWDVLRAFLSSLDGTYLEKDRVLHARASLAVHDHDFETAITILGSHCFPTYGALRQQLIELWHAAQLQRATKEKGRNLTRMELLSLRRRFRCYGDSTDATLKDPCVCGPPNLGYKYP
eukprot:g3225.t1